MSDNDVSELTAKEWLFHSEKVRIKDVGPKSYIPLSQLSRHEIGLTEESLKALGIPFRIDQYEKIPAILINEAAALERFRSVDLPTKIGKPVTVMPGYLEDIRDVAMIAKEARQASAAARIGKMNIAFAAVATVASVSLTDSAHAQQRDMAQTLHERGMLSAEALREYRTLSKDVQFMKNADTIVNQTAIGSPIGLVITENDAAQKFQAFSNKWRLPQEIHVMLGMSIFDGLSLRGKMAKDAENFIDHNLRSAPPELQALWSTRQAVLEAKDNYIEARRDATVANLPPQQRQEYIFAMRGKTPEQENTVRDRYFPELPVARNIMPKTEAAYHAEFDKIFSNRGATTALLSRLPQDSVFQTFIQMAIDSDSTDSGIKKFNQAFDKFIGNGDATTRMNEFAGALTELNHAFKQDPKMAHNFIFEELNSATIEPVLTSTGVVIRPHA